MTGEDKYQEFWDRGATPARLNGHPFIIVDYRLAERPDFNDFIDSVVGEVDHRDSPYWRDDFYGPDDMYSACSECRTAICYMPSSGAADKHWLAAGDILCEDCTRNYPDEYMEWYAGQISAGRNHGFLLDFEKSNFTLVLPNCANGLHEGDADDPGAIARWAIANGLQVAFDVRGSQFTTNFDVYMRHWDDLVDEEWQARPLTPEEVVQICDSLCVKVVISPYYNYCTLRREFTEKPSPAERANAMLKGAR
jgi:hypothetical protein